MMCLGVYFFGFILLLCLKFIHLESVGLLPNVGSFHPLL